MGSDHQAGCPRAIHMVSGEVGLHPNFISKALIAVTSIPTETDTAETCSFSEQWLVPLPSGLRKGVDERMHCITEEKNPGGECLAGVRNRVWGYKVLGNGKNTGILPLSHWLPLNAQCCSMSRCLQLPDPSPKMTSLPPVSCSHHLGLCGNALPILYSPFSHLPAEQPLL